MKQKLFHNFRSLLKKQRFFSRLFSFVPQSFFSDGKEHVGPADRKQAVREVSVVWGADAAGIEKVDAVRGVVVCGGDMRVPVQYDVGAARRRGRKQMVLAAFDEIPVPVRQEDSVAFRFNQRFFGIITVG